VNIFVHAFLISKNSNKRICSRQQWDPEDMSRAIISIRDGDCNQAQPTKAYNVPRQTLQRYLKKDEFTIPKLGRKSEMGIEAENELERYLILRQECGFGLTRHELRVLALNFMEKLGDTDSVIFFFFLQ
jgi:hypothetical protein